MTLINPVRICLIGPTASGKSSLALKLAQELNGTIVNADALQTYDNWQILTARPSDEDQRIAPHALYGHVGAYTKYSVGAWLRDIAPLLAKPEPLIIAGGTGLYFSSLLNGLAEIPETPEEIRNEGNQIRRNGTLGFLNYLEIHDPDMLQIIDRQNPMRLQRAWEVHRATGKPLSLWQSETPAPLLDPNKTLKLNLQCETNWLNDRIDRRFDQMIDQGALDECRNNLENWQPELPSSRALGAAELIASLRGEKTQADAIERAKIATHQFAKRQRTWIRSKMADWYKIDAQSTPAATEIISNLSKS